MKEPKGRYFPVFISLEGKKIFMAGAGNIGLRRAQGILRFGGSLHIAAPQVADEIYHLRERWGLERVTIEEKRFETGMIDGCDMVLSVTDDPETDRMIYNECRKKGIPVNVASDKSMCDFFFPALIEHGEIVMGISSGGKDHNEVREITAAIRRFLGKRNRRSTK